MKKLRTFMPMDDILARPEECPFPVDVIPNRMGINLCAVSGVTWEKLPDGQLVTVTIHFVPDVSGADR
jgi:hypothetical protein